ncbi:Blue light sensor protein [Burkholderiales bacterium 8X]|nr:Blue light sensor protein [Burkholderiales bacterium 8X]
MLIRLIYASRAEEGLTPAKLALILKHSQTRNDQDSVTGGLAYLDGVFLQYIEGPDDVIARTFARIAADPRHRDVKVLERRNIPRRMFSRWSMSLLSWVDETRNIFRAFSPGAKIDLYETHADTAAPLFRAWAGTGHWVDRQLV